MTELEKIVAAMESAKSEDLTDEARELVLYAENDSMTYHYSTCPACENLAKKLSKGTFDKVKAVKLFEYVAEYAAKRYEKEFLKPGEWHKVFTAETRRYAAIALLDGSMEYIEFLATRTQKAV